VVLLYSVAIYRYANRPQVIYKGWILDRNKWPESLVDLLINADKRQIQVDNLVVYRGPHDDYFWKCKATPELLQLMTFCWKLKHVDEDFNVVKYIFKQMPKFFSCLLGLNQDENSDYYVSAEYLPGGEWKGHLYCVMNDKTNNVIIVRYYYNF
jgi:hypothetical protein